VSVSPCGRRSVSIHRLAVKPADIYQKGSGLLARQRSRLESRGQLQSQNWEAELVITHHGTAHLSIPVLLLLRVLYLHPTELRTSITHSPHPYPYVPLQYPYTQHKHTPAPRSQLALPNASTGQPLYAHRDHINIQSTNPPDRPSRSANCGTAALHRPPYHLVRATTNVLLLCPSRAVLALARASPNILPLTGTCIYGHRLRKRRS
jgi:hypothetical protein